MKDTTSIKKTDSGFEITVKNKDGLKISKEFKESFFRNLVVKDSKKKKESPKKQTSILDDLGLKL